MIAPRELRRFHRRLAWLIVLVIAGLIGHGTFAGTGDEPHYQMIAQSLAFDRDLDLANNYADTGNLIFGGELKPEAHVVATPDGALRPVHDIGLPLLFAPYFAVSSGIVRWTMATVPEAWLQRAKLTPHILLRHLLSLAMSLFAVWIAIRLFDRFADTMTAWAAFGWAALLTLSPPLLSHAFLFFPDLVSAAVILYVFDWMLRPAPQRARPLAAGLLAGFVFLLHARNIGVVVAFVALAAWHARRDPRGRASMGWFLFGIGGALLLRTAVNYSLWGTWLTTPHARVLMPENLGMMLREIGIRGVGWIVDQEHGLLPYAPIYLLVPIGWFALWRRHRVLCVQLTVVIGCYIAIIAVPFVNPHGWRGGWSPAARFLVPVAPLLGIFAVSAVESLARLPLWTWALVSVQVVLNAIWWQHPKALWNDGNGVSELWLPLGDGSNRLTAWLPSLAEPVAAGTIVLGLLFAAGWLAFGAWMARHLAPRGPGKTA